MILSLTIWLTWRFIANSRKKGKSYFMFFLIILTWYIFRLFTRPSISDRLVKSHITVISMSVATKQWQHGRLFTRFSTLESLFIPVLNMRTETIIRLAFFFGIFAFMACWELIKPRRQLSTSKSVRWLSNLGITFINPVVLPWKYNPKRI